LANISLSVNFLAKFFEEYPESFKFGRIAENPYTPEISKAVFEVTKNLPLVFLSMILPKNDLLKQMLERGTRFLDIGCGRGNLIIQLAQVFKKSIFVGIDPDAHGIEEAKTKISQLGLEKRISVENLAGEDSLYHEEFDMVSMAVTLHEINPNVRCKVVEKAYGALKSNGELLILDFPFPSRLEDFRNPMYEFGILDQFFEVCAGFVHLNVQEQNEMLQKVGFRNIQRMSVGKGMFEFVTATK
jgi:ubiquinone/menaquinone biosynthesis C-methylase UbiE